MGIVELSTGHVFAAGSVKAITPYFCNNEWGWWDAGFTVIGVGFSVLIRIEIDFSKNKTPLETIKRLHQEAVEKLLDDGREVPNESR